MMFARKILLVRIWGATTPAPVSYAYGAKTERVLHAKGVPAAESEMPCYKVRFSRFSTVRKCGTHTQQTKVISKRQ